MYQRGDIMDKYGEMERLKILVNRKKEMEHNIVEMTKEIKKIRKKLGIR